MNPTSTSATQCERSIWPDRSKRPHAFQPAWAARAHLLTLAGQYTQAIEAVERAMALARSPRVLKDLQRQHAKLIAIRKDVVDHALTEALRKV